MNQFEKFSGCIPSLPYWACGLPRNYDPTIGRFMTLDPYQGDITRPLSLNKYLYGDANPVMNVDPTGYTASAVELGVSGNIALTLAALITTHRIILDSVVAYRHLMVRSATGIGGPDITAHLKAVDRHLRANQSQLPKDAWGWKSWDILELAQWGSQTPASLQSAPGVVSNGTSMFSTVTVNGAVYRPEEVNYYLYGRWLQLTGATYEFGADKIVAYRVQEWGSTGTSGRLVWYRAGYFGDLDVARSAVITQVQPSTASYQGTLYFQLGGTFGYTVFPDGEVKPGKF